MRSPSRGDHYRAELLWALGAPEQAREADRRALDLIANPAQRALLTDRISWTC
jgi:predicted RNA polymerase sigma factor